MAALVEEGGRKGQPTCPSSSSSSTSRCPPPHTPHTPYTVSRRASSLSSRPFIGLFGGPLLLLPLFLICLWPVGGRQAGSQAVRGVSSSSSRG